MNRFFRSALFPLIIIAALVWLALQTLGSHGTKTTQADDLGALPAGRRTNPGSISGPVTIDPNKQSITRHARAARSTASTTRRRSPRRSSSRLMLATATSTSTRRASARRRGGRSSRSLLPFVLLFGFWIFLMNQVQGGGSKVMSFGKSRAKRMTPGLAEDRLQGRRRRRRGGRGAAGDQGVPREPEEVPGARRAHPEGRAALRAARHRQDAARARGRRRGGRPVLLDLRLRLRRDVRRRRRLAACATCSSRRSRRRRASSSWTRSTPSAAIAAPASAAATTSASRR